MRSKLRALSNCMVALAAAVGAARLEAGIIGSEPNNAPNHAFVLPVGQLVLSDDLNGNVGRPDTLLGEFDPQFKILSLVDDNGNPAPNHKGSQLLGVPLRANGSAYFSVTGTGDVNFTGNHTQSGQYSILYQIRDPQLNLVSTLPIEYENVTPGMLDYIWIDPNPSKPNWTGYTVDVTINNIVGPGTGDSLDWWVFSGLLPGQAFTAKITGSQFPALTALANSSNVITTISNPNDPFAMLTGTADAQGKVKIGVSAVGDTLFKGEHAEAGTYTLQVFVPEPSGIALALMGAVGCLVWVRRCRAAR